VGVIVVAPITPTEQTNTSMWPSWFLQRLSDAGRHGVATYASVATSDHGPARWRDGPAVPSSIGPSDISYSMMFTGCILCVNLQP
jgi:hypothetical protein